MQNYPVYMYKECIQSAILTEFERQFISHRKHRLLLEMSTPTNASKERSQVSFFIVEKCLKPKSFKDIYIIMLFWLGNIDNYEFLFPISRV